MTEEPESEGWESVPWHPPRFVNGRVTDDICIVHILYMMSMVPHHRTGSLVKGDDRDLDSTLVEHRDRLIQEHGIDMGLYVELGTKFMYTYKDQQEKFEAGMKLYDILTPLYTGLHESGLSHTQIFG